MGSRSKRRMQMNRQIPRIGAQPQQVQIGPQDTTEKKCSCGGEIFRMAYRLRMLPAVSPKNPTGKDVSVRVEILLCEQCGAELQ